MTIIEDVGESITVRLITRTIDIYGDTTNAVGSVTTTAAIIPSTAFTEEVASGILDGTDMVGIFKPSDVGNIKDGNEVYCTAGSFTIQETQPIYISTTLDHIEAVLKTMTAI